MSRIGDNFPPSAIETVKEAANDLSAWMAEHPTISNEMEAREAKPYIDRSHLVLQDMEAERDGRVRPLNTQVAAINDEYRQPRNLLKGMIDEIQRRVGSFLRAEESRRAKLAEEARIKAERAALVAQEAERVEQERIANARAGELGVNLAEATQAADEKFEKYARAEREAQLAEKEVHLKIGGGFRRAISLKTKERLTVSDPSALLRAVGLTVEIEKALLSAARNYRKLYKELPPGVAVTIEEEV